MKIFIIPFTKECEVYRKNAKYVNVYISHYTRNYIEITSQKGKEEGSSRYSCVQAGNVKTRYSFSKILSTLYFTMMSAGYVRDPLGSLGRMEKAVILVYELCAANYESY